MASKKPNKGKKHRNKIVRLVRIDIGKIIFAVIFAYLLYYVYVYYNTDHIQFYEVVEGNIVNDCQQTGMIFREEQVQRTDRAGYINYYIREGKRASVGTRIYSIDETGTLASFLEDNPEANVVLTDKNLADIKHQLSSFSTSFQEENFRDMYDQQYTVEASVLEYVNFNTLGNLDALLGKNGLSFQQVSAPLSGVVSYAIDGYEELEPSSINASLFDRSGYTKKITKAGTMVGNGSPVYKLITSDNWSILFPLSEEDKRDYAGKTSLHVTFLSNDLEADGAFSVVTGSDGETYGRLDFNQYMVQFVSDRYTSFVIDSERVNGLKIPVTSVASKSFFLIPTDYMVQGGDSNQPGFMKEVYTSDGTLTEFIPATIYYSTEEYYYVDMGENSPFKSGDYMVKPDSSDRYQIGPSASLQGTYSINKGYAVFKQIEILNSNSEYYTVKKGTSYGLSVYDHIVLDAKMVYEGELIYR